ncbi:MAG: PepSY-associated TM helix domain-containing protein, partial [Steroidobacteraceae bacterium]
ITALTLGQKPNEPFSAYATPRAGAAGDAAPGASAVLLMLDPYTGEVLRRERYSDAIWPISRHNIMPLVNQLHYQLAIPGTVGLYLFGIVALVWTIDCFVGAYLTFPIRRRHRAQSVGHPIAPARRSWWLRWKPAWLIKRGASAYRVNFDLHRAGGLWLWLMLLVLAWTGVGFNLNDQVYVPVMRAVIGLHDAYSDLPTLSTPRAEPGLSWRQAHLLGRQLMAQEATMRGFQVQREGALQYIAEKGVFLYSVRTNRDLGSEDAASYVLVDAGDGAFKGIYLPTGQTIGGTVNSWLFALHMAQVGGLPFRLFVSAMGLVVAMLSITGVYIWLQKKRAGQWSRRRTTSP